MALTEKQTLMVGIAFTFAFMAVECAGGVISHSLALLGDAAHMLTDTASFAVALAAAYLKERGPTKTWTYGLHRVEVLAALASTLMLWLLTGMLVLESFKRIHLYSEGKGKPVNGRLMVTLGLLGVVMNVALERVLGAHSHGFGDHGHSHGHGHGGARDHGHGHHGHGDEETGHGHHDHGGHSHAAAAHGHAAAEEHGHGHGHSAAAEAHDHAATAHDHGHAAGDHHDCCGGHGHGEGDARDHGHGHAAPPDHAHAAASAHGHGHAHAAEKACAKGCCESSDEESHGSHDAAHDHGAGHDHRPAPKATSRTPLGGGGPSYSALETDADAPPARRSINIDAAYLHVLGDLLQSLGVVLAGIIIWRRPDWQCADPVMTLIFAAIVLYTTSSMLVDTMRVLLEGAPADLDVPALHRALAGATGVADVHDLHVWQLTAGLPALSCHVILAPGHAGHDAMLAKLQAVSAAHGVDHACIQVQSAGACLATTCCEAYEL